MDTNFIEKYYTSKVKEYGATSKGVDWKDSDSQNLRFKQLLRGFSIQEKDSILDYGCGYGAFLEYLNNTSIPYYGYDISVAMLEEAKKKFSENINIEWSNQFPEKRKFDYTILSGIFNVRNNIEDSIWKEYILDVLNSCSIRGSKFNLFSQRI